MPSVCTLRVFVLFRQKIVCPQLLPGNGWLRGDRDRDVVLDARVYPYAVPSISLHGVLYTDAAMSRRAACCATLCVTGSRVYGNAFSILKPVGLYAKK